ncbi:MAG: hypothetical protein M1824_006534 [Vezdaea acicularis]|nr:MAG: hypothetical protein M1824_006534 [Vezdaea acicularis]
MQSSSAPNTRSTTSNRVLFEKPQSRLIEQAKMPEEKEKVVTVVVEEMPRFEPEIIDRKGGRFAGPFFTLTIGQPPETAQLSAHQSILSQSPTLARFCSSPHFLESRTHHLSFPDDHPIIFSLLLEYLYTSDYEPTYRTVRSYGRASASTSGLRRADLPWTPDYLAAQTSIAAQLYVLAEKYQLPFLQSLIASKLPYLTASLPGPAFFAAAKSVYDDIPDERRTTPFFDWFRREGVSLRRVREAEGEEWWLAFFEGGGRFARDLVEACDLLRGREREGRSEWEWRRRRMTWDEDEAEAGSTLWEADRRGDRGWEGRRRRWDDDTDSRWS